MAEMFSWICCKKGAVRMTVEETLKIMAVLKASYPNFYRDMKRKDAEGIVNLWADMFSGDDYRLVAVAVKALIASDSKGFPPVIGQVKEKLRLLTGREEMTEQEAWGLVAKAVRNGIWGAQEEFEKLPEDVQRIVGSPEQLRSWAQMESDSLHSVVASNFQRAYRVKAAQKREYAALPEDVKAVVQEISGGKMKVLEGS